MPIKLNRFLIVAPMLLALLSIGCSTFTFKQAPAIELPPTLSQDELIRPYVKLGRIQITREVFVTDWAVTQDIREWGIKAVREEAAKMGADAVIFPEVTGRSITTLMVPASEYRATGVAIKFK